MYIITAEEAINNIRMTSGLSPEALSILLSGDEGDFANDLLYMTASLYLEHDAGSIYETALSQILSVLPITVASYIPTVERLIEAGKVESFLDSVLLKRNLPPKIIEQLIPYGAVEHADLFLSPDFTSSAELLDLFTETYVGRVLESKESLEKWVNRMGFENLYLLAMDNQDLSKESKMKFQQLMIIWRSTS